MRTTFGDMIDTHEFLTDNSYFTEPKVNDSGYYAPKNSSPWGGSSSGSKLPGGVKVRGVQ